MHLAERLLNFEEITTSTNAPWYLHTLVRVSRNMFRTKYCNYKRRMRRALT